MVTNAVDNISVLTVENPDVDGNQFWRLSWGRTLGEITHLKCRSARFRPLAKGGDCSPKLADQSAFPLQPDQDPPEVANCSREVYAVPIIFAVAE